MSVGERGPNYDWKHEAEHYRDECDKLRELLSKVEASGERDAWELEQLKRSLLNPTPKPDVAGDEKCCENGRFGDGHSCLKQDASD